MSDMAGDLNYIDGYTRIHALSKCLGVGYHEIDTNTINRHTMPCTYNHMGAHYLVLQEAVEESSYAKLSTTSKVVDLITHKDQDQSYELVADPNLLVNSLDGQMVRYVHRGISFIISKTKEAAIQ